MAHSFEIAQDVEVAATPEQVWDAIATGGGWDSWFMGRNEIEPREGGEIRWSIGDYTEESTVTAWDPPRRFVSTGSPGPDGYVNQFEYRIEGREGEPTKIRWVHSGMRGDDWEAEYEAMSEGDPMYLHKLAQYLTYFLGRTGTPVDAQGPPFPSREGAMARFRREMGLSDEAAEGSRVDVSLAGLPPIDGVVDYVSPSFLGVRSSDAIYRFIYGFTGDVMVGHNLFGEEIDQSEAERAWGAWLTRVFAPTPGADTR